VIKAITIWKGKYSKLTHISANKLHLWMNFQPIKKVPVVSGSQASPPLGMLLEWLLMISLDNFK